MQSGKDAPDVLDEPEREQGLAELHLARTDLQATVQGAFMEELLGLPTVTAELDRIDQLIDRLAALPDSEIADRAITAERDRQIERLATDLKLPWAWLVQQLQIGLWWRQQLVQAERRQRKGPAERADAPIPGWPPKWTYDRRVLAVGGSPWALVNFELVRRLTMKRGDSLPELQRQWREISAQVEFIFASSMFSSSLDEGPPGGISGMDVAAYERYARWAVRKVVRGESYRQIAREEFRAAGRSRSDAENQTPTDARERWREIKKGVRKALEILDSI